MSSDQIRKIEIALARILLALEGDAAMGQMGVVDRVKNVEITVNAIQQERRDEASKRKGAKWVVGTIATAGGIVGGVLTWLSGLLENKA